MSIRLLTGVQSIRTCLCEIEIKFSFFSHFITICFFTNLFQSSQRYMIFSVIRLYTVPRNCGSMVFLNCPSNNNISKVLIRIKVKMSIVALLPEKTGTDSCWLD